MSRYHSHVNVMECLKVIYFQSRFFWTKFDFRTFFLPEFPRLVKAYFVLNFDIFLFNRKISSFLKLVFNYKYVLLYRQQVVDFVSLTERGMYPEIVELSGNSESIL
jgi:hypothetical protein